MRHQTTVQSVEFGAVAVEALFLQYLIRPAISSTKMEALKGRFCMPERVIVYFLVNLQQYPAFGCYAINRDIWRDELIQNLIEARFVFWQSTTGTRDAIAYAQHFRVSLFPHVAVLNPNHRSHIWGIEGWTAENPWTTIDIAQKLSEITFDRFSTEEQLTMEVDEEPFLAEPMVNVLSEIELQASILGGDHDLLSAVNISEFYELQQVMLLTSTEEQSHTDTARNIQEMVLVQQRRTAHSSSKVTWPHNPSRSSSLGLLLRLLPQSQCMMHEL